MSGKRSTPSSQHDKGEMIGKGNSADDESGFNHEEDETFDIRSPYFDAKKALAEPGRVKLPQKVFPLENLSHARPLLPPSHQDYVKRRIVNSILRAQENDAINRRKANEAERKERKERREQSENFENPLLVLAQSFSEGPNSVLKQCMEKKVKIRVITGTAQNGIRGSCVGYLQGFDKYMNLFLSDVEETYSTIATAVVSMDIKKITLEDQLFGFLRIYSPSKAANAPVIARKYAGKETELWQFLHVKYGLVDRVRDALTSTKTCFAECAASPSGELPAGFLGKQLQGSLQERSEELLRRYRGREPILMSKLGIADTQELQAQERQSLFHKEHTWTGAQFQSASSELDLDAEWIQRESLKYSGRFFYYNTKTKQSVWEKPADVNFRTIEYSVIRHRNLRQTILRGDNVVMCSPYLGASVP